MRILTLSVLALPLAACAEYSQPAPSPSAPGDAMRGACNADAAQTHLGQQANEEAGAAILAESGAEVLRWGPPNSAWTMDYRTDRVNVRYDEARLITEITCG